MSREKRKRKRQQRREIYRQQSNGRVIRTGIFSPEAMSHQAALLAKQFEAMPGKPEEKYLVVLGCAGNTIFTYPIYGCADGFTAALQDAIRKHQRENRPQIQSGRVQGIGDFVFAPPDLLVQMMAKGVPVLVTNRAENRANN